MPVPFFPDLKKICIQRKAREEREINPNKTNLIVWTKQPWVLHKVPVALFWIWYSVLTKYESETCLPLHNTAHCSHASAATSFLVSNKFRWNNLDSHVVTQTLGQSVSCECLESHWFGHINEWLQIPRRSTKLISDVFAGGSRDLSEQPHTLVSHRKSRGFPFSLQRCFDWLSSAVSFGAW